MRSKFWRIFFRLLAIILVITIVTSLYANFLHDKLFFSHSTPRNLDSAALNQGIKISFESNGYQIRGRLIAPPSPSHKLPVIIFSTGSGENASYAAIRYPDLLKYMFSENLAKDSVALLYIDKRGVGESEGKWYDADFADRAADVKAAADYLKTINYIDTNKIIAAGHSQGGWIVEICLAKYPETFAGGIIMMGPTVGVKEQVINERAVEQICENNSDEQQARKAARKIVARDIFMSRLFPFQEDWKQFAVTYNFEPANDIRNIHQPVLFLFGENDSRVNPAMCLDALHQIFGSTIPSNINVTVLKNATHRLKIAARCYSGPDTLAFSNEAKDLIRGWVERFY